MKLKKSEVNYIVDLIIGIAFLLSVLSGIILLFFPSGDGFRGGRNSGFAVSVLGMDRWFVKDLHSVSSILMTLGVLGHFILHWNWLVCMTKKVLKRKNTVAVQNCEV